MPDPRKIERAIVDYLRREGVELNNDSASFEAVGGYAPGGMGWSDAATISIDTLRLAEAIADDLQ